MVVRGLPPSYPFKGFYPPPKPASEDFTRQGYLDVLEIVGRPQITSLSGPYAWSNSNWSTSGSVSVS